MSLRPVNTPNTGITPTAHRILLVDDDDAFRGAICQNLESFGYPVISFANGKLAKEFLEKKNAEVDLVISDIRMPEFDGLELTKFIKGQFSIPVILVTGFSEIIETEQAHKLGADEFLPKPFDRMDLQEAVLKSLKKFENAQEEIENTYCKLGIGDFISGRQIQFSVFLKLTADKYIRIAHKGEDLPADQVRSYREKGVKFLYLRQQDFRNYVGFSLSAARAVRAKRGVPLNTKLELLKRAGEVLMSEVRREGVDQSLFEASATFVETAIDVLADDPDLIDMLDALNKHTDHLFAHSVGTSLYSVLIAKMVEWNLPTNKFKVAMGGLLHDIGLKEIDREYLMKPRSTWTREQQKLYETHPTRGTFIMSQIPGVPSDVIQIIKEHHENCQASGFPSRIKKNSIHPMAKLVSVADEFCKRVLKSPDGPGVKPEAALDDMSMTLSEKLDPEFFGALLKLFDYTPSANGSPR